MSNRYRHPTYGAVTVVRNFGYYAIVATANGNQNVQFSSLTPLEDPIPFPSPEPPSAPIEANGGSSASAVEPEADGQEDQGMKVDTARLAINKANANLISKQLPYVGKLRARQIVEARPKAGFASFDDLKNAVPNLFGDSGLEAEEWIEIEPLISYES